jgi:hypothetical protein
VSELSDALDALLAEHTRIGSPAPGYLRPGLPADDVARQIAASVGFDPPAELTDLYAWHDGFDNDAWRRDDVAAGFARLFDDTYFAPLADAVASRRESIQIDETTATYAEPGTAPQSWKPSWFPAFCQGWDDYGVECQPGLAHGRIYAPSWQPPAEFGPGPRFRDLQHLLESVIKRFQAGGYRWDRGQRFLVAEWDVIDRLAEVEGSEAPSA